MAVLTQEMKDMVNNYQCYVGTVSKEGIQKQLRDLEQDNLIYREVFPVIPPKVEYGLTEFGNKIIPLLHLMHGFGSDYLNAGLNR